MVICNRNCKKCRHLSGRTDDKGYPFGYDCLRYQDSVFFEQFDKTKVFDLHQNAKE